MILYLKDIMFHSLLINVRVNIFGLFEQENYFGSKYLWKKIYLINVLLLLGYGVPFIFNSCGNVWKGVK